MSIATTRVYFVVLITALSQVAVAGSERRLRRFGNGNFKVWYRPGPDKKVLPQIARALAAKMVVKPTFDGGFYAPKLLALHRYGQAPSKRLLAGKLDPAAFMTQLFGAGRLVYSNRRSGEVAWKTQAGEQIPVGNYKFQRVQLASNANLATMDAVLRRLADKPAAKPSAKEVTIDRDFFAMGRIVTSNNGIQRSNQAVSYTNKTYAERKINIAGRFALLFGPGKFAYGKNDTVYWRNHDGQQTFIGRLKQANGQTAFIAGRKAKQLRNRYLGEYALDYLDKLSRKVGHLKLGLVVDMRELNYGPSVRNSAQTLQLNVQRSGAAAGRFEVASLPISSTKVYSERLGVGPYAHDYLTWNENLPEQLSNALDPASAYDGKKLYTSHVVDGAKYSYFGDRAISLTWTSNTLRDARGWLELPAGVVAKHTVLLHRTGHSGTGQVITHRTKLIDNRAKP
ncbi:MAG: hypothetical protein H6707_03095 [Deltaproteobacteria bacterium]|nr:hypothetical protein [Deltaproteobacteria bacterium]